MRRSLLAFGLSLFPLVALAAPQPGIDLGSLEHQWWECQEQPVPNQRVDQHLLCCSLADGHMLGDKEWRIANGHYEVNLENHWFIVPESVVIKLSKVCGEEPNADNRPMAKVWYTTNRDFDNNIASVVWYCFLPGTLY